MESDELEPMSANNDEGINIPSVFVGAHTGRLIIQAYQYNENFALLINNDSDFNINTHLLLPFTIVVGLCFLTMVSFCDEVNIPIPGSYLFMYYHFRLFSALFGVAEKDVV